MCLTADVCLVWIRLFVCFYCFISLNFINVWAAQLSSVCVSSRVNDCALLSGSACKHSIKHTHIAHIKVSPLFNLSTWHTLHAFLWKTHMYYLNVCSLSRQRIVRNLSMPITIPNMVRVCLSHSEIDKNDFLFRFVWSDTCDLPFDRIHSDHWW